MKKQHVKLSEQDRTYLENLIGKGKQPAKTDKRAIALLELNRGSTFKTVAQVVGVTKQTTSIWAEKYRIEGLGVLIDKPRPGRPVEIDGITRAKITALACSEAPEGHGRWTLRLLADKAVELEYCEHLSHTNERTQKQVKINWQFSLEVCREKLKARYSVVKRGRPPKIYCSCGSSSPHFSV